jgi:TolB-like protein
MKKVLAGLGLFFCGFALFAKDKPTVAVALFDTMDGITREEAAVVTELFAAELVSRGTVRVVDRSSFDKSIAKMQFQTSDWSDSQKTAALGRAAKASYVILGKLMQMDGVIYWTVSLLEVTTAEVLYSLSAQIDDLAHITNKLPVFCAEMLGRPPLSYSLGDRGPGGGTVFLSAGDSFMECSEILGIHPWDQALTAAQDYRGGGYANWRLPTKEELNLIYQNLRKKNLGNMGNEWHWSSTWHMISGAWGQRFSDGYQFNYYKSSPTYVRAVRAFSY